MTRNRNPRASTATDAIIGARIKSLRRMKFMSQETLADAVGVTFQQVQKYEGGTNRLSVAALLKVCDSLAVTPGFFLDCPELGRGGRAGRAGRATIISSETLGVVSEYERLPDHQRKAISGLIAAMRARR